MQQLAVQPSFTFNDPYPTLTFTYKKLQQRPLKYVLLLNKSIFVCSLQWQLFFQFSLIFHPLFENDWLPYKIQIPK